LCVDPKHDVVLVANNVEAPFPFATLISTKTHMALQRLRERLKKAELSTPRLRRTARKKCSISRKRPPGTKRGGPCCCGRRLSPLRLWPDLETSIDQSLDDDLGSSFGVQNLRWKIVAAEEIGQHVLRSQLAHAAFPLRPRIGCAARNVRSLAMARSIRSGIRRRSKKLPCQCCTPALNHWVAVF
jgi:hypothetical protein